MYLQVCRLFIQCFKVLPRLGQTADVPDGTTLSSWYVTLEASHHFPDIHVQHWNCVTNTH